MFCTCNQVDHIQLEVDQRRYSCEYQTKVLSDQFNQLEVSHPSNIHLGLQYPCWITSPFQLFVLSTMVKPTAATKIRGSCKPTKYKRGSLGASYLSFPKLQTLYELGKKVNLHSKSTQSNYDGQIMRGHKWLEGHFAGNANSLTCPWGMGDEIDRLGPDMDDVYTDLEFKHAFSGRSNKHSHQALLLFVSFKCFHENLGKGTSEQIHATFKKHWSQLYITSITCAVPLINMAYQGCGHVLRTMAL